VRKFGQEKKQGPSTSAMDGKAAKLNIRDFTIPAKESGGNRK
jgi:hypothetical protein